MIIKRLNTHKFWFPWKVYYYAVTLIAVVTVLLVSSVVYKIVESGDGTHTITLVIFSGLMLLAIAGPFALYFLFAKKLRHNVMYSRFRLVSLIY